MMEIYTTVEGDELDDVCERWYGFHKDTAEAVLAANINLSAQPAILPAGIEIIMPDIASENDDVIHIFS